MHHRIDILKTVRRKDVPESIVEEREEACIPAIEDKTDSKRNCNLLFYTAIIVFILFASWTILSRELGEVRGKEDGEVF